jgi:hypothetical protein
MRSALFDLKLEELVRAVIGTVAQEYPHKLDQELNGDADLRPPRQLNPAFYGCYDWHSAVHSHWLLVRSLVHPLPEELRAQVGQVLNQHLSPQRIAEEVQFFSSPGGRMSERPYGWAWLLLLQAQCSRSREPAAGQWTEALEPLSSLLRARLLEYLSGLPPYPIRSGTHANTALALQLTLEASRLAEDGRVEATVTGMARQLFPQAGSVTWAAPPGAADFLSPPLTECALMAEVMPAEEFRLWLGAAALPAGFWRAPEVAADDRNFGGAHMEGLLVTRAWSMAIVARALGADWPHAEELGRGLDEHLERIRQIQPLRGFHRAHWLPTFLLYLEEQLTGGVDRADGMPARP